MATLHHNISGELAQELIPAGDNITVNKISLSNIQKVSNCKVDLYIEKKLTGRFYLIRNVNMPYGTTLILDNFTNFSTATGEFGLYIKLTDGDSFTLTGSIDPTGANTSVPGHNTLFLSELSTGDEIVVSGETRTIAATTPANPGVISDTSAVVTVAWGSDLANDTSPDCNPTALVDVIIN
tara:strand:+ start:1137 stop:1679 length:543 start_codon:yes stop_codon:yes gene_type:complete